MTIKIVGIVASLSAAALTLSADEIYARGGITAPFVRPGVPIARPVLPPGTRPFLHRHGRGFAGTFWPGDGFYGDAPYGGPMAGAAAPLSNDVNYTYTYKQDVPWDWAHRFPPNVAPSNRPYVSTCSNEPVTVPGSSGDQTVNVIRCY